MVDGKLVSARKLEDIPAFNRAMLEVFENAQTKGQSAESPKEDQEIWHAMEKGPRKR